MSEPGWHRFRAALVASFVLRVVAVLMLAAGGVTWWDAFHDHNLSRAQKWSISMAGIGGAIVGACLLAVFAYVIPILVAIYDEARTPRVITPGPPPAPVGRVGPSFGYSDPPPPR